MNLLDFLILAPLVFALARGIYKGLINELASLAALFLGIYVAYKYAGGLNTFLLKYIEEPGQWTLILSYTLIFIAVFLLIMLISRTLTKIAGMLALGLLNRLLGGLFGLIKMLMILFVIIHLTHPLLNKSAIQEKEFFKNSILYDKLVNYSSLIGRYMDFGKENNLQEKINSEP